VRPTRAHTSGLGSGAYQPSSLPLVCVIPIGMGCVPGWVGEADQGQLLRTGLWYLSTLFLTLVCMIPNCMGCVPGGVSEADQGPLLRTRLWYLSAPFLTLVCVIPNCMGCVPGGFREADQGPFLRMGSAASLPSTLPWSA
jgi:hypothetical protein